MPEIENVVRVRTIKLDGEFSIDVVRKERMIAIRYEDDPNSEILFESAAIQDLVSALFDFDREIKDSVRSVD